MATPTYDPIASTTLSSSASSVTFSSLDTIAAGYRDLVLVVSIAGGTADYWYVRLRFNGDTGNNYSSVWMQGNGSSTRSSSTTNTRLGFDDVNPYAASRVLSVTNIMDFSATDKHKSTLTRHDTYGTTEGATEAYAGRWANTSAITSVEVLTANAVSYAAGSVFSLYGIVA